ncbi:hypothetical protein BJX76DRAFT_323102 [Aspergillus varians]
MPTPVTRTTNLPAISTTRTTAIIPIVPPRIPIPIPTLILTPTLRIQTRTRTRRSPRILIRARHRYGRCSTPGSRHGRAMRSRHVVPEPLSLGQGVVLGLAGALAAVCVVCGLVRGRSGAGVSFL